MPNNEDAMIHKILHDRPTKVFLYIAAFFVANALIAECIGTKLFSLEKLLGIEPHPFSLLGEEGLTYTLTCGVLLWPLEFVITDIVNEFYGRKAVKLISWIAIVLIGYAFVMFYFSIEVPPNTSFWITSQQDKGIPDMQAAFAGIFGQGMWIIVGSLTAFMVSQLLDAWVFQKIKKRTGQKHIWLRATGSTVASQLIDSFIVLFIAFKLGQGWSYQKVLAIGLVNYSYKFLMALALTPAIYFIEHLIVKYVGEDTADAMRKAALDK
jgi:uncharacterized integral membrane protein (TIGR00697 family)